MKHRVSFVCMVACAFCLVLGLAGCSQSGSYEGKTLTPSVSAPTIGTNGTLRVGINADGGAPFVTSSSSAKYAGLDIDMAAALADQLGLKLELVDVASNAAKSLSDGDVDIVMGQSSTDKSSTTWLSSPYLETGVVLFASSGTTTIPTAASAASIAAQSSSTSAWAVENAFGDDAVSPASDLVSAFSLVETGKADYVAADAVIGSYAALRQSVDVTPIALLGSKGGYCIGVSSSNQNLQKAISGALTAIMGNGVADAVCSKWLGSSIDLDSLTAIEVSSSKASSADKTSGDGSTEQGTTTAETASTSTAGANAIQPNTGSSASSSSNSSSNSTLN